MHKIAVLMVALVGGGGAVVQDAPKMPAPQKEHEWLKQLAGEWETDAEMVMGPGQPTVKSKGTESVKMLGGFWSVAEMKGDFMGMTMTGLMTLGYDPGKKKYVGTFVSNGDGHMWKYEGSLDPAGKVLTLETEGPNPSAPGKRARMRDVIEVKRPDHKVLTSHLLAEDGKWVQFMTMTCRRKK